MKIKLGIFLFLLNFNIHAEIPLVEIINISKKNHDVQESQYEYEPAQIDIFSPLNGFLALKTVLPSLRLGAGGKYGLKIDNQENLISTAFQVTVRADEVDIHAESKKYEYPNDAVSAAIQWYFPSVDGAILVENDRVDDPVGELYRSIKSDGTLFANFLNLINLYSTRKSNSKQFSDVFISFFPSNSPASFKDNAKRFSSTIHAALVQDGTFQSKDATFTHDQSYPKNIILHTILAFLVRAADNKEQITSIYQQADLSDSLEKSEINRDILSLEDYFLIKDKIIKNEPVAFEDLVYAAYSYELYEKPFPEMLQYGKAIAPKPEEYSKLDLLYYADCGETALRNFFNIILYDQGGIFNPNLLPAELDDSALMIQIKDFYKKFPTFASQLSQNARDEWSLIVSDLNKKPSPDHPMDVCYHGYCNIAGKGGVKGLLNIFAKLTKDSILLQEWSENRVENESEAAIKISRLCEIFSRQHLQISWSDNKGETEKFPHNGSIRFKFKKENFTFLADFEIPFTHFKLTPILPYSQDWRKTVIHDFNNPYLDFYFKNSDIPYLNPLANTSPSKTISYWKILAENKLREVEANLDSEKLKTRKKKRIKDEQLIYSLRFLYKLFVGQRDDPFTQIQIMKYINILRDFSSDQEIIAPILAKFIDEFLLTDMLGENLNIFKYEFSYPNTSLDEDADIFTACKLGLRKTVKELLNDVNSTDKNGMSLLMIAAQNGHLEIAKLLILAGADVNYAQSPPANRACTESRKTALMYAAENNEVDLINLLISYNADKDYVAVNFRTAFWFAAFSGSLDALQRIKELGCDINPLGMTIGHLQNYQVTPLSWAINNDFIEIAQYLLSIGADINISGFAEPTILMGMSAAGSKNLVNFCLENGADVNKRTEMKGETALMFAAKTGQIEIIRILLLAGAKIDDKSDETYQFSEFKNASALQFAAYYGHLDAFKVLLSHGADFNATGGRFEDNILALAVQSGSSELVNFLLEDQRFGEFIEGINSIGMNALMHACKNGFLEIANLLLHKGASLEMSMGRYKNSPMLSAIKSCNIEIIKRILEINPEEKNKVFEINYPESFSALKEWTYIEIAKHHRTKIPSYDINSLMKLDEIISLLEQSI